MILKRANKLTNNPLCGYLGKAESWCCLEAMQRPHQVLIETGLGLIEKEEGQEVDQKTSLRRSRKSPILVLFRVHATAKPSSDRDRFDPYFPV